MRPQRSPIEGQITFLYAADLERASAFYGGDLGLELVLDQGRCRIYRVREGAHVGVCALPDPGGAAPDPPELAPALPRRSFILTIVTEDVDGWYATLVARGVAFDTAPRTNDAYGIYHCFLRDPDGHRIEIQRFLADTWRP